MNLIKKAVVLAIIAQSSIFALTGKVQDSQGNALKSAYVKLVETGSGTITNDLGEFVIQAPVKTLPLGSQSLHFQVHQGVLHYSLSQSAEVQFQVLSLMGQVLQSSPQQVQSQGSHVYAPAQKLSTGLYLLRYFIGNEQGVLPLQVTDNSSMNLRHDLMPLRKTAEGAEDSLQIVKAGYITQRIAVVDYTADLGVIVMQKYVANPQSCLYSDVNNTLTCAEKTYKTVVIGTQVWMAENLNFGTMVLDAEGQKKDGVAEKFCYKDSLDYCSKEGGLYTWAEALALPNDCNDGSCESQIQSGHHQGACPTGWHVPKEDEWTTLGTYLGGFDVAGSKMKLNNLGFSKWDSPTKNDGNSSGFSAFPTGLRLNGSNFGFRGQMTYYWGAAETVLHDGYFRNLGDSDSELSINIYMSTKLYAFSVRCLRDN